MLFTLGVYMLVSAMEGLACAGFYMDHTRVRQLLAPVLVVLLAGSTTLLVLQEPSVWVWGVPLVGYRALNLLRLYYGRLPLPYLRTVSIRAFGWLLGGQLGITAIAWLVKATGGGTVFVSILACIQLVVVVILLRATLHTWRHAAVSPNEIRPVVDRDLPAVSVLVPARNETKDLEVCLQMLLASDYPKLEILVLDDCSATRRTPDIIRSFAHDGVRFIQGEAPDEAHWLPKNFAYEQLAREASGDVLLFCGVDAVFEPQSIRALVGLLESRRKDMLSVMPLRRAIHGQHSALIQSVRYFWELCLPRRMFKRPPVLSTCWLVRSKALERMGGFDSVRRSVIPEAPFARRAVTTDAYSFVRSDATVGIYSNKVAAEQYNTSVRVRYPQLHRRLELVALWTLAELVCLLGPMVGLVWAVLLQHQMVYALIWAVAVLCQVGTYALVTVGARLTSQYFAWIMPPIAWLVDLAILHISFWKYEFGTVNWKGRNVCVPVMRLVRHSPRA